MSTLALDAEALYGELRQGVQRMCAPNTRLVGIVSGGYWLAQRLHKDLNLPDAPGAISSAMHRDDFAQRGLAASAQTSLPFEVNGADILLLDDVLYTGRAQKFARQLRSRFNLPVAEVDERYSTTEALASGARDADAASACIILEQFLRSLT